MLTPGFHALWSTPLAIFQNPLAALQHPVLIRALQALRLAQCQQRGVATDQPFFASDDDLLRRLQIAEGQELVRFFVESLKETITQANTRVAPHTGATPWGSARRSMQIVIEGLWFQISRAGAFHDVHTHGNCSWSGVYVIQVDASPEREQHPTYGVANGATRFIGPYFQSLGGAHVDLGNAYLLPPQLDVAPVAGQLIVFPAWLAHQALPYAGEAERIILSFNASVHAASGSDQLHRYGS